MTPILNKSYRLVFTNHAEYYNNCNNEEKHDIKTAVYIGKDKKRKLLFRNTADNSVFSLYMKSFLNMVIDENNETRATKPDLTAINKLNESSTKSKNISQNYLRFVECELPYAYSNKVKRANITSYYIALQIKNTLYYVKDGALLKIDASKTGVLIDPCDDIPLEAPQKLIDLYNSKKSKS